MQSSVNRIMYVCGTKRWWRWRRRGGVFHLLAACSQPNYFVCRKESISVCILVCVLCWCCCHQPKTQPSRWGWWCKWLLLQTYTHILCCWKAVGNTITVLLWEFGTHVVRFFGRTETKWRVKQLNDAVIAFAKKANALFCAVSLV